MNYIDFHTHHPSRQGELVIQDGVQTYGLHPWQVNEATFRSMDFSLSTLNSLNPRPLMIGECGLDGLCSSPYDLQLQAFLAQARLSQQAGMPLLIHCLKRADDLVKACQELRPQQPWIWHGFRGKPQQLLSLLPFGFYFSFGFRYNEASLKACPLDRLLLETDDDPRPIQLLYQQVAVCLKMDIEALKQQMQQNFNTLCPHYSDQ